MADTTTSVLTIEEILALPDLDFVKVPVEHLAAALLRESAEAAARELDVDLTDDDLEAFILERPNTEYLMLLNTLKLDMLSSLVTGILIVLDDGEKPTLAQRAALETVKLRRAVIERDRATVTQ